MKFEKITLWTAVETDNIVSLERREAATALDYIIPRLNDVVEGECHILSYDTEDYELVKVEEK